MLFRVLGRLLDDKEHLVEGLDSGALDEVFVALRDAPIDLAVQLPGLRHPKVVHLRPEMNLRFLASVIFEFFRSASVQQSVGCDHCNMTFSTFDWEAVKWLSKE